jgi:adenylate kinase family enzyme
MQKEINKIHILGGPGAGKTYLGNKLSKLLNIPCYSLDEIVWGDKSLYYDKQIPAGERNKKLKELLLKKTWIIEGVYYKWVVESFKKADLIIILKPNVWLRDVRIIKGFILKRLNPKKVKRGRLSSLFGFLKWNHYYDKVRIKETLKLTEPFEKKRAVFEKADDVLEYFNCSK